MTIGIEHGPGHATLACLEGIWSGQGETFPNPWSSASPTFGEWRFRFDRRRLNLIHDYAEERVDGALFDAHGVLTMEPVSQDVLWFWFDAHGYPPLSPSRGKWDGTVLMLERVTPRGIGRAAFEVRDHHLLCSMEARPAGTNGFVSVMAGRYAKVAVTTARAVTAP